MSMLSQRPEQGSWLNGIQKDLNEILKSTTDERAELWQRMKPTYLPQIDISESEEEITLTAELPGLDEDDFEVIVSDNALTLKGEKSWDEEQAQGNNFYSERGYGRFSRTIPLPTKVDPERAEGLFKNGLLTVKVAKQNSHKVDQRKINITVS